MSSKEKNSIASLEFSKSSIPYSDECRIYQSLGNKHESIDIWIFSGLNTVQS